MPACTLTGAAGAPVAQRTVPAVTLPESGCLPAGNGYLRARIRGALNLDLNWRNAELECEGEPRPDGSGIRVSFAGPTRPRRAPAAPGVRGEAAHEGTPRADLPTNLTLIVEGAQRLYTTRGEDHCTVDYAHRAATADAGGGRRALLPDGGTRLLRVPGEHLNNAERILVSSFDFAGTAVYGDDATSGMAAARHMPTSTPSAPAPPSLALLLARAAPAAPSRPPPA